eukprot:TRINITY_DN23044_c0_g1_i1.p3 TRINITY_DN23044_c0_g1~~TRINITY_DN23044_c0_g1_i1.p3  ORF type:complete len:131 (+),score=18.37 TRINITY_DN23044_c0_g1_i1:914-1306(+)
MKRNEYWAVGATLLEMLFPLDLVCQTFMFSCRCSLNRRSPQRERNLPDPEDLVEQLKPASAQKWKFGHCKTIPPWAVLARAWDIQAEDGKEYDALQANADYKERFGLITDLLTRTDTVDLDDIEKRLAAP